MPTIPKSDTALVHFNPEGSTPAYMDLYQNVTVIPPGARVAIVSSQWACDKTGQLVEGGRGNHKLQAKQMFENVFTILHGMGCTMENVIHRGNRHFGEWTETVAKDCIEGSLEACPDAEKQFFFKSSCSYAGYQYPPVDGMLMMVDITVMLPN